MAASPLWLTTRRRNYKRDLVTVAGYTIPTEVVAALVAQMKAEPFTFTTLSVAAERELRQCAGDVSTYFTLADRMLKKFSASGDIIRVGEKGRASVWKWVSA